MTYRRISALFLVAGIGLTGTVVSADPATQSAATATASAPPVVDPALKAAVAGLIKDLASDDFKVRKAAQEELEAMDRSVRPAIEDALKKAKDEEVEERLRRALEKLTERDVLDPPPISIDLKDASMSQVAAALSKATGEKITSWPPNDGWNSERVTLKADKKRFWEVLAEINKSSRIDVQGQGWGDKIQLTNATQNAYKRAHFEGAFVFVPTSLSRTYSVQFGDQEKVSTNFNFSFRCGADPRTRVLKQGAMAILAADDDKGQSLLLEGMMNPDHMWETHGSTFAFNTALKYPENPGKRIAHIKGGIKLTVMVASEFQEVGDLSKMEKKTLTLSGYSITLEKVKIAPNSIEISYKSEGPKRAIFGMGDSGSRPSGELQLIDAKGVQITSFSIGGGGGSIGYGGDHALPITGRMVIPTRVKDVDIPFEFKDLPMP